MQLKHMGTNKELLVKGIKQLGGTVFLFFLAPFVLNQAFKNQDHPFYLPVLIVGIVLAILAILQGFRGIRTVMRSLFND